MRYSEKTLEKGICPTCKNPLIKKEFYERAKVVYKNTYSKSDEQWYYEDIPEVQLENADHPDIIEYECDKCQINYHIDKDSFIGES